MRGVGDGVSASTWVEMVDIHNRRYSCAFDGFRSESHSCRPSMTSPRPRVVPYWMQEDDLEEAGDSREDGAR